MYSEIAVGLCSRYTGLNSLPGWTSASWGYHGDDGHKYSKNTRTPYSETFNTGDIIGCRVSLKNNVVFTKNGASLGKYRHLLSTY
jgi:Ran-binding protein 9/10